jgi:hypothetical protein
VKRRRVLAPLPPPSPLLLLLLLDARALPDAAPRQLLLSVRRLWVGSG